MNHRKWAWIWGWLCSLAWAEGQPQLQLPRIQLQAGMHQMQVQVAATPDQRAIGLMHRAEMPQAEGMLFAFEQASQQCFWMKNTLLPLTAAFIADDGTIVNLADMKPQGICWSVIMIKYCPPDKKRCAR